jgi:hypothetical protein
MCRTHEKTTVFTISFRTLFFKWFHKKIVTFFDEKNWTFFQWAVRYGDDET